jgi:hypothetical protein
MGGIDPDLPVHLKENLAEIRNFPNLVFKHQLLKS